MARDVPILRQKGNPIFVQKNFRSKNQRLPGKQGRAAEQLKVLVKSLTTVIEKTFGSGRWKAQLIIFVGRTCGSVNTMAFNKNLKELQPEVMIVLFTARSSPQAGAPA